MVLSGCIKTDDIIDNSKPWRTYFLYVAGDNNLTSNFNGNIIELSRKANEARRKGGRIIVYYSPTPYKGNPYNANDTKSGNPVLFEVLGNSSEYGTAGVMTRMLKEYDYSADPERKSIDPEAISLAINDMMRMAPAESYIIDFSSHGFGWTPAAKNVPVERAFGGEYGGGSYMEYGIDIDVLASIIPDSPAIDAILFDACEMGCVEVAYELRNKTKYLMASVAEIPAAGFPYAAVNDELFNRNAEIKDCLVAFASKYIDKYENDPYGGTIAIYDCSMLPALKDAAKEVVAKRRDILMGLDLSTPVKSAPAQFYYDQSLSGYRAMFHDMRDLVRAVTNGDIAVYNRFVTEIDKMVVYKNAVGPLYAKNFTFSAIRYSGVTMFVPQDAYPDSWVSYYKTLSWYKDVWE